MSYMLTCLPMYSFFVSSSVAANIEPSLMTINPVNVRALIQPFLHDGRQRGRQTQVRKTLRYDLPQRNVFEIAVSKSYSKYCVYFASTWDVSTNAEKIISPVDILILSQQQSGALRVLEVSQGFPSGVSKWRGRLSRVVDPPRQTPLYR